MEIVQVLVNFKGYSMQKSQKIVLSRFEVIPILSIVTKIT